MRAAHVSSWRCSLVWSYILIAPRRLDEAGLLCKGFTRVACDHAHRNDGRTRSNFHVGLHSSGGSGVAESKQSNGVRVVCTCPEHASSKLTGSFSSPIHFREEKTQQPDWLETGCLLLTTNRNGCDPPCGIAKQI